MFKRILLGIIAVTALALFWTEADAQTCTSWRNVAGSRTCVRWTPGSEDCTLISTGGALINSTARCEVDPVFDPESETFSLTGTLVCIPAPPSEVTLTATTKEKKAKETKKPECKNHEFNGRGEGHDHHDDDCIVTPNVTIDGNDVDFPLFAQTGDGAVQCKGNNCTTRLSVNIPQEQGDEICSDHLDGDYIFVNFTAKQFLGTARICEGGNFEDSEGVFCDNGVLPQLFQQQLCTISEDGRSYLCEEVFND
jgi:hypothetical protein